MRQILTQGMLTYMTSIKFLSATYNKNLPLLALIFKAFSFFLIPHYIRNNSTLIQPEKSNWFHITAKLIIKGDFRFCNPFLFEER